MEKAKLKRCPFCGGKAIQVNAMDFTGNVRHSFYIECQGCNAVMGREHYTVSATRGLLTFENPEDAVKAWNTRKVEDEKH